LQESISCTPFQAGAWTEERVKRLRDHHEDKATSAPLQDALASHATIEVSAGGASQYGLPPVDYYDVRGRDVDW